MREKAELDLRGASNQTKERKGRLECSLELKQFYQSKIFMDEAK